MAKKSGKPILRVRRDSSLGGSVYLIQGCGGHHTLICWLGRYRVLSNRQPLIFDSFPRKHVPKVCFRHRILRNVRRSWPECHLPDADLVLCADNELLRLGRIQRLTHPLCKRRTPAGSA